jgi:hypothetical protein
MAAKAKARERLGPDAPPKERDKLVGKLTAPIMLSDDGLKNAVMNPNTVARFVREEIGHTND